MYKFLYPLLRKPDLYERTLEKFWNDAHISEPYDDGSETICAVFRKMM
jgi:hypothetical protein